MPWLFQYPKEFWISQCSFRFSHKDISLIKKKTNPQTPQNETQSKKISRTIRRSKVVSENKKVFA